MASGDCHLDWRCPPQGSGNVWGQVIPYLLGRRLREAGVKFSQNDGDLTGWSLVAGLVSVGSHFTGVRVYVAVDEKISEDTEWAIQRKAEEISELIREEQIRRDPNSAERAARERNEILSCFDEPIFAETIPNGYCSQYCCRHLPWFIITTKVGRIKIGWRKRVIEIDWSDSAVKATAEELFPDEDVTKYDHLVHAWSVEKARQYVDRIVNQGRQ